MRGNLRLLAGMVRANRPWRLIVRLSRALAAAAAAVVTTGAQASDAIRALVAAGAADVRLACVARTIDAREPRRIIIPP